MVYLHNIIYAFLDDDQHSWTPKCSSLTQASWLEYIMVMGRTQAQSYSHGELARLCFCWISTGWNRDRPYRSKLAVVTLHPLASMFISFFLSFKYVSNLLFALSELRFIYCIFFVSFLLLLNTIFIPSCLSYTKSRGSFKQSNKGGGIIF